jgi:hypothetical protein
MVRVMSNHELFVGPQEGWLFIALDRSAESVSCDYLTLNDDLSAMISLNENDAPQA